MPVVILSPHLDDAVFSCWHLLGGQDVTVLTVFAGIPAEGTKTLWDRICGQPDSAAMMRFRRTENGAALKGMDVNCRNLDHLDAQYRPGEPDTAVMADQVLAEVGGKSAFYAPIAASMFWRHPDHIAVRELGKHLLERGEEVSFYADIPYMQMPTYSDRTYSWYMSRRAGKLVGAALSVEIVDMDVKEQALKRQAMHGYGSQYTMTNLAAFGMLGRKANIRREVIFRVSP